MHRRHLLLGLSALALLPLRLARADSSATVGGMRLTVQRVVNPADPSGFSLGYWNHDTVAAIQLTVTNTRPDDVVFHYTDLYPPADAPRTARLLLLDDTGNRRQDVWPTDDVKRATQLWSSMIRDPQGAPMVGDPVLKSGATAAGWLYFQLPESAHLAWLELTVGGSAQAALIDLGQLPVEHVDPSAYAALNAQRAAYRPDLEPKALVVPADQMPGTWDSPSSSQSSSLGQFDGTYYDLTDLGRANRAMRFAIRDRKTPHDADVETGRRATTFASFGDSRVDPVDGLGDGLAFRAVYSLPELSRSSAYGMQTMLHVLYGFRVDRFGLEVSAYQPDASEDDLQALLDGVVGEQVERIRSALAVP